jgi:branched-chain amino acid transport system ATP-binding protein
MGINLEIMEGERHAIIGPNGAGKSTLFNIITGLYQPSRGKIFFQEMDITGWPVHMIARIGLSRSFQIINIFPKMSVFENVRSAIISKFNQRFNWFTLLRQNKKIQEESDKIIDLVALSELRDIPASELNYGAQRQLELALTLARDPLLIMLDEPTAGLNAEETRNVVQLIKNITVGKTLIIVEHDMEVVFTLADRITVLNYGGILATGSPDEIRQSEEVKRAYLGRK